MKTREEIDEMFRQYESKWGKLGHTSILHPERNKEEKTMSIMDNELYKFRQKVFNGKEANKVSHKSMVNITELNRQYFERVTTDGTLIHAQNPLYGQQNPNAKYYKREGQPGKYRYYYTKEEWDAAHKQGSASTEASREAQERQQYENNKKAANNNVLNRFNNMRADVVNEYAKIAREGSAKDAAKAFYDMGKGGNEAIDELYSAIQEGFKNGKLSYKDGRFETDDDQLKDDIEAFSDNIQKFAKQIGEASGKGREIQNELEKLMLPDIEAMSKKAEARKDNAKKAQSGREAAEKAGQKNETTWDNANVTTWDDVDTELDKKAKHSTSGKTLITNSAMGDEIVDEYKAFQEKVKKGKEKNRLAHTATISPAMLNARYEEELNKKGILIHQANYKYYNKIDLGNGNTRYFYTKAEWDAYQREKGSKTNTNQKLSADTLKQIEQQKQKKEAYDKNKAADEAQKKAESDKWDTHKKIREDFHQIPGYMTYSSRFIDDMKATPEGSDKGKEYFSKVLNDAYEKYPSMKNIKTDAAKDAPKPKDEEVFAFMDEVQKGIDKYTKNFVGIYQLPEQEYTPLINNYFLSMTDQLMKDGKLDYDYVKDVYYRNSDVGKKEAVKEEILKQGHFNNRIFREDYKNKFNKYNEIFDKDYDRDSETYKNNLQNFAENGPECKYLKESIEELKNRRTADGKQQYSDEDIYNAAYTFLWKNFQKQAVDSDFAFSPDLYKLIPDIMNAMGYKGSYTADPQDLILKIK